MKILYTGFAPFGEDQLNASYEAVRRLADSILGVRVLRAELPTAFTKGAAKLWQIVEEEKPEAVICVGQASGRAEVPPEYVAINCQSARLPDNDGYQPFDKKIMSDGPDAYFTKLPVHDIVNRCREEGIPSSVSYTAGTYVCNDVMYSLLHFIHTRCPDILGGFIHLPCLPSQAAGKTPPVPSMDLSVTVRALEIAGEEVIRRKINKKEGILS